MSLSDNVYHKQVGFENKMGILKISYVVLVPNIVVWISKLWINNLKEFVL